MQAVPLFQTAIPLPRVTLPGIVLLLVLPALSLFAIPASAQRHVVIYRCTDASGALTIQNDQPCPKGSQQQKRTIDVPPPMPAYEARAERMPGIVAAEKKQQEQRMAEQVQQALPPPVPEEERKPPSPLFECTTWDKATYLSVDENPPQRCVPIQVVGLDGRAANGAAQACRYTTDTCTPVPEDTLCRAWQRRVDEARFRAHFAGEGDDNTRQLEYETMAASLRNSTCGG